MGKAAVSLLPSRARHQLLPDLEAGPSSVARACCRPAWEGYTVSTGPKASTLGREMEAVGWGAPGHLLQGPIPGREQPALAPLP